MSDRTYAPGFQFTHPGQGLCTVTRVTGKAVRYTAAAPEPGYSPIPHVTTPGALTALLDAGILHEVERQPAGPAWVAGGTLTDLLNDWVKDTAPLRAAADAEEHPPCLVCGQPFPPALRGPAGDLCPRCEMVAVTESATVTGEELLAAAADLHGPDGASVDPEYTRALVELVCHALGLSTDDYRDPATAVIETGEV